MVNSGEDVLVFYNDRASFQTLIQMMRSERDRMDENSPLLYHIHLVELLAVCTEGKNVYTEIKCNSLLPLDDIVRVVTHEDCIPEVGMSFCCYLKKIYIYLTRITSRSNQTSFALYCAANPTCSYTLRVCKTLSSLNFAVNLWTQHIWLHTHSVLGMCKCSNTCLILGHLPIPGESTLMSLLLWASTGEDSLYQLPEPLLC